MWTPSKLLIRMWTQKTKKGKKEVIAHIQPTLGAKWKQMSVHAMV